MFEAADKDKNSLLDEDELLDGIKDLTVKFNDFRWLLKLLLQMKIKII